MKHVKRKCAALARGYLWMSTNLSMGGYVSDARTQSHDHGLLGSTQFPSISYHWSPRCRGVSKAKVNPIYDPK